MAKIQSLLELISDGYDKYGPDLVSDYVKTNVEAYVRGVSVRDVRGIASCGSDETPYFAARMSFNKNDKRSEEEVREFIAKLIKQGHGVPFQHAWFTCWVKGPIMLFRQLERYRHCVFSEQSMRYSEPTFEFYIPESKYYDDKKELDTNGTKMSFFERELHLIKDSIEYYKEQIESGINKEDARTCLPVSVYSHCLMSCNPWELFHILEQRLDYHAQSLIRMTVWLIICEAHKFFPIMIEEYLKFKGYEDCIKYLSITENIDNTDDELCNNIIPFPAMNEDIKKYA